jgi:hypothetical protein
MVKGKERENNEKGIRGNGEKNTCRKKVREKKLK